MKNIREYYRECFEAEKPKFLRVFAAVPDTKCEYRPHERSQSAKELVWMLARELDDACELMKHGEVDFKQVPPPSALADSRAEYEKNAAAFQGLLAKVDDAGWDKPAKFKMDGQVVWEAPLGDMLFGFLFDAVHHRGQLSTYLRPMGAKVPSIYGPSADDPGM
jgi:uncharacterized damage-inducible protein DinB